MPSLGSILFRLIGCILFVGLVSSVAYGLRTAVVDYDPITVSMKANFERETDVKIYYVRGIKDEFDPALAQTFHVAAGERDLNLELKKVDKVKRLKIGLAPNAGAVFISGIKVTGPDNYFELNDISKFKNAGMELFVADGNVLTGRVGGTEGAIEYDDTFVVRSNGNVWGFPINKYTLSALVLIIFAAFWWLLSVVEAINRDIAEAMKSSGKKG